MQTSTIPVPTGVKGLIFDLDGTIIDSMGMHHKSFNYALELWGVYYSKEVFHSRAGLPIIKTLELIASDHGIQNPNYPEVVDRIGKYIDENAHQISIIEPIFEIIKEFHGKLPMAIGTGSVRKHVDEVLEQFGINDYIEHSVTATDVAHGKPHPETFLKCAEMIGVEPQYCVVYEDGVPGMEAARTAGMQLVDVTKYL